MLSRMVGGDAGTFACARLNEMIGGKKWTWQEFTTLVKGTSSAEGHNRYDILSMEEIKESKDSTDNKIFPIQPCHQRGPLVGSPGMLNLGLIPLTKTTKILQKKKSQKMHLCAASNLHEKYAYLSRLHQLVAKIISSNSMHF